MEGYPHERRNGDDRDARPSFGELPERGPLPACPAIPHHPEDVAAADAAAEADIAAGRVYGHDEVTAWLRTWGSPDYLPFHEWRR